MGYKCPLCLLELTQSDRLGRFCTDHPRIEAVEVPIYDAEESLPDEIYCTGGDGSCNNAIDPGVFLHHVGCASKNPFWNSQRGIVDIPGADNTTVYELDSQTIQVSHWEIGMLRAVPPTVEEMWFPLMLLRATAETRGSTDRKRIGALVQLAGSTKVGKTVLAMQALEYEGYVPDESSNTRDVEVRGYIFSRLPPGRAPSTNPLLGNLYLSNLMRLNKTGLYQFPGTIKVPGDLKAGFIAPSRRYDTVDAEDADAANKNEPTPGVMGYIREFIGGTLELLRLGRRAHRFWYTVAFYDAAGEAFLQGDPMSDAIERASDKVAILVDATEIFGQATDCDSIAVANDRIGKVGARGLPHCLVVTKLDLVMNNLSSEQQEKIKHIAEDLQKDYGFEARELLKSWLDQRSGDDNIKQLRNRLDRIGRVFFIWTENLPTSNAHGSIKTSLQQPRSYGLARFIAWCLGVSWEAINQK